MTNSYRGPQPDPITQEQSQAEYNRLDQVDQLEAQVEEEKKKKQATAKQDTKQQQALQAKNKANLKEPTGVGGVLKEVGTAVVGAGIDAVEGIGANVQQAVTGNLANEKFVPTWLQVDDKVEPLNKTWWGQLIRGVGEFGVLSAVTRGAGGRLPGKAGAVLGGKGIGSELVRGAIAGNLSSQSQGENLSRVMSDTFAWFPDVLATKDDDNPLLKRLKNTLEGLGLDAVFDAVAGGVKGLRAKSAADNADLLARQAELQGKRIPKVVEVPPKDNSNLAAEAAQAETKANQAARQANFDEMANTRLADDPEGLKGPDPYVNSPLYDRHENPVFSVKRDGLEKALLDEIKISTDPRFRDGRVETLFTESAIEKRLAGENPIRRQVIESVAKRIGSSPEFIGEVNGVRVTRAEFKQVAIARALDTLDLFDNPEDLDAFKAQLLSQPASQTIGGKTVTYMNTENLAAAELLLNVTAGEAADIATAARSVRGAVDTTAQEDMILRRMEFLLKETKLAKFIWGQTGNQMKGGGLQLLSKSNIDEVAKKIDSDVASTIAAMKQLRDQGDDNLIQHFMDAISISDGKIKTLVDLDNYVKDSIWKFKGGAGDQGGFIKGLQSTFINSVLSGTKTYLRAWTGTSLAVALRPITLLTGGLMRGDDRLTAKAFHQMAVWHEGFGEAMTMFSMSIKNHIAGEGIPYSSFAGNTDALHKTDRWQALGQLVEARGNSGDKAGYRIATVISKFNNSPFVSYSMGLMGAGDAANRTILGRMELKSMAFDRAWTESGGKVDANLIRKYETEMHGLVFDKDGLVTDKGATMAGDEASLTTDLSGGFQKMEDLFNSQPLLKPFFLFPKTSINALKYTLSYSPVGTGMLKKVPILNSFLKEVDEVMNVTPDTLEAVMSKYGIKDIEAAQAMYEGRVAFGQMVTLSATGLYLSGSVTGNGPHDKQTRNAWVQSGWKPRSIKLGGVWVGYDSLDPFASLLALVADIGDNSDQLGETFTETGLERVSYVIAMNLTNKSFLAGIQPLAQILSAGGAGASGATMAANIMNSTIPYASLRKEIADGLNPGMRELEDNVFQVIANRNPGFKGMLPYKNDTLNGQPLRLYDPIVRFANVVQPFQINPDWNETRDLLRRSGFDVAYTLRTNSKGMKLDAAARSKMQNEMGKEGIEKKLEELFKTQAYADSFKFAQDLRAKGIPSNTWPINAMYHTNEIRLVFEEAKRNAEFRINSLEGNSEAVRQSQLAAMGKEASRQGDIKRARQIADLLKP